MKEENSKENYNLEDSNFITKTIIEKFDSLPKKGKPSEKEKTILSSICLKSKMDPKKICVVSIGTGTKCLPKR